MVGKHLRDDLRDPAAGRDVQEFVGAVRVGMRPQHAGHDKLRLRETLAEYRHERDAAAFAHIGGRHAEGGLRGARQRGFEPRRQGRRVPARGE